MSTAEDQYHFSVKNLKPESYKNYHGRDSNVGGGLWTDGLICAFEFVRGQKRPVKSRSSSKVTNRLHFDRKHSNGLVEASFTRPDEKKLSHPSSVNVSKDSSFDASDDDKEGLVLQADQSNAPEKHEDLVAPFWERPAGPIWWCHVSAGHPSVETLLRNAQWLHPAVSLALRDESRLINERMQHLLYEVPVRVAGGLLFELLGQSVGDPLVQEDDIPIVLRSWQAQNFLVTVMHIKGSVPSINVLGIREVQELLSTGGYNVPRTAHEVIAQLAFRLSRWDDRVKWSLHARDEIIIELLQHLKGNVARNLLEEIKKSTREMIEEQEEVRGRLFTIQDVMQSTLRAWLQDKSLTVTHYLAVFGGVGLVLSMIIGLFGVVLIVVCLVFLGPRKPAVEEHVEARKLELQKLVKMFQHDAETHARVRKNVSRNNLPPTAGDAFREDADYLIIQ
ncbi:Magnesium transporter CorA family protein [Trifolium repens]|nr:Magnesium transporter CorA family protein [Trifolium repens]